MNENPVFHPIPDFAKPFLTCFTGMVQTHGSIYLVEPLPDILTLPEIWRELLWKAQDIAVSAICECVNQLDLILQNYPAAADSISPSAAVLTTSGMWGLLGKNLNTITGVQTIRNFPNNSILDSLWAVEQIINQSRPKPILRSDQRNQICKAFECLRLKHNLERKQI